VRPLHRRLLRESAAARRHLALAVALGAGTAAAIIAQATLLARVVVGAFLEGQGLVDLRWEIAGLVAASLARGAMAWGYEVAGHVGAARVMSALRTGLVEHVLRARPGGLDGVRSGELATAAVQGVDALEAYFARYVPQMALSVLVPLAILGWIVPLDAASALLLAVTLPLVPVFMVLVGRAAARSADRRVGALQAFGGRFLDVVRGLPTLRAHNRAEAQGAALRLAGERFRSETMATLRVAFLSALVLELAATLGVALVAVTVGVRLVDGGIGLQAGLVVLVLAPELYHPLRQLGAQYHASADGLAAAERVHGALDLPPALSTPARPVELPDPRAAPVRLEGVWLSYPTRPEPALRSVDLELRPGEHVALVGPSGAGKSTVAALLVRLADPDRGRVSVGGVDLREADAAAWRRQVAWVPQRPSIVAGTVSENVRMGDREAAPERVREALRDAGALGFVDALPSGVETPVGEGGHVLSAGQARRVALARAFLRDAPLVVLDEPTADLDPETAAAVADAVGRLGAGRTLLVVTHRPALAARADRVVRMAGGRVESSAARPAAVAA